MYIPDRQRSLTSPPGLSSHSPWRDLYWALFWENRSIEILIGIFINRKFPITRSQWQSFFEAHCSRSFFKHLECLPRRYGWQSMCTRVCLSTVDPSRIYCPNHFSLKAEEAKKVQSSRPGGISPISQVLPSNKYPSVVSIIWMGASLDRWPSLSPHTQTFCSKSCTYLTIVLYIKVISWTCTLTLDSAWLGTEPIRTQAQTWIVFLLHV